MAGGNLISQKISEEFIMAATEQQRWSPEQYAKNARFVSDLGMPVVTLLAPRAGERILDVAVWLGHG